MFDNKSRCYNQSHINVQISNQNIVALVFLTSKCSWHIIAILRSSRSEGFCEIGIFKHFAKFIGKQLCRSLFSYNIPDRVEKRFRRRCLPIKFSKFSRTSFSKSTSVRLILDMKFFRAIFCILFETFRRWFFTEIISLFLMFVPGFRTRQRSH